MQKNLFNKNKIELAIERIKMFEPLEGYYLAFSGGKDSVILKKLTEMAQVKYDTHYSFTTIDPPELVKFIKQYHSNVIFEKPKTSFFQALPIRGFPLRQNRWCCEVLKECHGSGRKLLTGIRWEESNNRAKRNMVETCYKDSTKTYVNPIIDWTVADVWGFIKDFKVPYCELYNQGFKRIGCLFCPMRYYKNRIRETELYPKYTKAFIKAFERLFKVRKENNSPSVDRWQNGEEMFWWWINAAPKKQENENQIHLFP